MAPSISHLFFNNDTLISGHATTQEAINLKFAIDLYSAASGQCINFEKSGILFSSNTNPSTQSSISRIWQMPEVNSHRMYLGLPSVIEANKKQIFSAILDKCWAKFHGWKEKNLSQAGRIIIIQSVIQSIPAFAMHCFKLPYATIDKIQSLTATFLWSGDPEKCSIKLEELGKTLH
ncbi:hypothetical protein DH2020_044183 [Rehmannia glutinosa]|uniref:Uncharacterized protein n=1 Tax=Rehmannia glutinosa TaxID=99300 RepID=A0ABR0UI27_REHGL